MVLKMSQALEIPALYQSIKDCKMPIKTAYKFNKLIRYLEEDLVFYQSQVASLLNEYAARNASGEYEYSNNGAAIKIIEGKQQECNKKLGDLLDLRITISDVTFELEELNEIELTVSQLDSLMPFIVE